MLVYPDEELRGGESVVLLFCDDTEGIIEIFVDVTMDSSKKDGTAGVWVEGSGVPSVQPKPGKQKAVSVSGLTYKHYSIIKATPNRINLLNICSQYTGQCMWTSYRYMAS